MKNIVIVGGGITGLATAFYLRQYARGAVACMLIESAPRLGGKITSSYERGFIVEGGPDSFLARKPATQNLCRELGLNEEMIGTNPAKHPTYVWSRGRLHPMPFGIMPMARSQLVSWPGKLRMGLELLLPRRQSDEDESLGSFVRRRLGVEALDKVAAPLMAGIYAADPETQSLRSTFPMLLEMEKAYGSVLRGWMMQNRARRNRSEKESQTKRAPMFVTLRSGLQQLVNALAARLDPNDVLLNCRVLAVRRIGDRYEILLHDGTSIRADDIVFATPAYTTADLVEDVDPVLAAKLRAIRYVSTATVSLGFKQSDLSRPLDGFGFVVPHHEDCKITACSWSSAKFAGRAPDEHVLLRVFVGGARAESLAEQDEAGLVNLARQELRTTMGVTASPILSKAYRWPKANPQYEVGHETRIADIHRVAAATPGLHLAGAAYYGPGIPDCIQSGLNVALSIKNKYCDLNNDLLRSDSLPCMRVS